MLKYEKVYKYFFHECATNIPQLILFKVDLFGAAHIWGKPKGPPPKNLSLIFNNDETLLSYTLIKEDQKNI